MFLQVKNKQFDYMQSEKSDVIVTSQTNQLQETNFLSIWLI